MSNSRVNYLLTATGFKMVEMKQTGEDKNGKPIWEPTGVEREFSFTELPEHFSYGDGVVSLASYGLSKKLQDTFSQIKGDCNFEQLGDVYQDFIDNVLANGDWVRKGQRKGGASSGNLIYLAQALLDAGKAQGQVALIAAELAKLDKEKVKTLLEAFDDEIKALKAQAAEVTFNLD